MSVSTLLTHLPDHSRIWLYLAEKPLSEPHLDYVKDQMTQFTQAWQAHGAVLSAGFALLKKQLLILAVDETQQPATGCSIDASYRMIKNIEQTLGCNFSNRLLIPIWDNDQLRVCAIQEGATQTTEKTLVLDLTLTSLGEFREKGIAPMAETWMRRYLPQTHTS